MESQPYIGPSMAVPVAAFEVVLYNFSGQLVALSSELAKANEVRIEFVPGCHASIWLSLKVLQGFTYIESLGKIKLARKLAEFPKLCSWSTYCRADVARFANDDLVIKDQFLVTERLLVYKRIKE